MGFRNLIEISHAKAASSGERVVQQMCLKWNKKVLLLVNITIIMFFLYIFYHYYY